ncbi:MAG: redoxin domain-containing protein [Gammaproteobacteria bacterium]|nr:redoxin domain-containing protein [Gammaproteobacteria bacterium]
MIIWAKLLTLKFWLVLIAEILFATAIFMALSAWQEQDMLDYDSNLPTLNASSLNGTMYQFHEVLNNSKKTLVYFFAPWCNICHLSIGNLNIIRNQIDEDDLLIIIVALDWKSKTEVEEFIADHDLNFPVLLGNKQWQQQYKITGFPSYYVLNQQGEILSRSMGYSSSIGMLRRIFLQ